LTNRHFAGGARQDQARLEFDAQPLMSLTEG